MPFSGVDHSGMGNYHGKYSYDSSTHSKSVTERTTRFDILLRYFPYSSKVLDWLRDKGLEFYLESNDGLYGSEYFAERAQKTIQVYTARKGNEEADKVTVKDSFPDMIFGENLYREKINKISFVLNDYSDYLEARDVFSSFKVGTWGGAGETA